ncbi:MAG TPA: hypothetical protein VGV12_10675 [Gemmatimonadales bacterium]|nr:hypothetical protein [Gemmatimonadales bacterium]
MRRWTPFVVTLLAAACAGGDRTRTPTCGMALLIAPSLIQEQLRRLPFVLTETPRGLPATLPVRVAGTNQQSSVQVSYAKGVLTMDYQGPGFPATSVSDTTVYALLVVDDSTQRAQGVLIYESRRPPAEYPSIGQLAAVDRSIPLYGVRVEWANVSNPRCPLFGAPAGTASPGSPAS